MDRGGALRVLITGVTGQDGSYLAEQMAAGGHEVFGLIHGQRNPRRAWIQQLVPSICLVDGDLLDQPSLARALAEVRPDVVFNLGALTFVGMSWRQPSLMTDVTGLGCLRMLEAIRQVDQRIRFLQASTSEMFGDVPQCPQNEGTPFQPRSPYGTAKVFAHQTTVNYRQSYGLHASTVIMFNHESPRRGEEFVTRKVTLAAARIAAGQQRELRMGNLTARRDWGWAQDYVRALPLITGRPEPEDFVLATGETHSVQELCEVAFLEVGLDWRDHVVHDEAFLRPADVPLLQGDATKARDLLGWEPTMRFKEIIQAMVRADLEGGAA